MKNVHGMGFESPRPRNPLFALLLGNLIGGAALGLLFVAGAIALDLGHLRKLITFSADGAMALFLLSVGSIVTFASVAMGSAIMMVGAPQGGDPDAGKGRRFPLALVPRYARAGAPRRRRAEDLRAQGFESD